MVSLGIFIVICSCHLQLASTDNYNDTVNLLNTLLTDYDSDLLPRTNGSSVIEIKIDGQLYKVTDVDSLQGSLTVVMVFMMTWKDEKLTWDPAYHGFINTFAITQKRVWTPPLTLSNPIEVAVIGMKWMYLNVHEDGSVSWAPGDSFRGSCDFNMKFWPFDKQVCDIGLVAFGFDQNELKLNITSFDTRYYTPNSEWELEEVLTLSTTLNSNSNAVFRLKLKRQSAFYVLTIIIPLILTISLNSLVFLLPSESGERVGFSITILLSIAVFLTVISDSLPKSADPVSLMCVYILIVMIISTLCTLFVILNLMLYHRKEIIPVGKGYRLIVRFVQQLQCKSKISPNHEPASKAFNVVTVASMDNEDVKNSKKPIPMSKENLQDDKDSRDGDSTQNDISWEQVSTAVDKVLFVVVSVGTLVPSVVFVMYMAFASDYE